MCCSKTVVTNQEKGSVMLEAALILPLVVLLLISMFDVGLMIHTHATLTEAANEAIRVGSRVDNLEEGEFIGTIPSTVINQHRIMHNRVSIIIEIQSLLQSLDSVSITTSCENINNDDARRNDTVSIVITVGYRTISPLSRIVPLTVNHSAPYLSGSGCLTGT